MTSRAAGTRYYTYDGDSKRVSQRTADGYTGFVYQGPDMLALQLERNEAGTTQAHYTIGRGLESVRRSGVSHFYHYNHLGTTIALTASNQTVSDTYDHDAWGVLLSSTGSTVNPHTYVGRERYYLMSGADLYHLGFRDYDQALGRFMTVDPARDEGNWFAYVANQIATKTDALGLAARSPKGITPPCLVVIWIGDTHWYGLGEHAGPSLGKISAQDTKKKLEGLDYVGYEVQIIEHGKVKDLQNANRDARLVGVATASHGGCGWYTLPAKQNEWQGIKGSFAAAADGKVFGAWTPSPPEGAGTWEPVRRPNEFVAAYSGHCYNYWLDDRYVSGTCR